MLDLPEVDVLVATTSVSDFAAALARTSGITGGRVASVGDGLSHARTAAPTIAHKTAQVAASNTALLVFAGAGITVVVALDRP